MLDEKIARVEHLITERKKIDAELKTLLNIEPKKCSRCGSTEHSTRSCPNKQE